MDLPISQDEEALRAILEACPAPTLPIDEDLRARCLHRRDHAPERR